MKRKTTRVKAVTCKVLVGEHYVPYQVAGEGEPVILVHGLSGSRLWWVRNVPALAEQYRVYVIDLPGFGSLSRSPNRFALTQAASWLLAWMDAIGLKRAHFIGHSMGGYICMWIAAHRPEVVNRLILISPAVILSRRSVLDFAIPLIVGMRYMAPSFFLILAYDAIRTGPVTFLRAVSELLTQDAREEMKLISVPTLLVWGEGDTLVPPSLAGILRMEIATSHLLTLRRAGHVSMFDQATDFNRYAIAFLHGEGVGE